MMRRAPNTNATQEVRVEDVLSSTELRTVGQTQEIRGVDILEELPIDAPQVHPSVHTRPAPYAFRDNTRDDTPSIAPFEVDIDVPVMSWPTMDARRAESTVDIEAPLSPPPRRLRVIVGGVMLLSGLILSGAAIGTVMTTSASSDAPRAATTTVFVRMRPAITHPATTRAAAAAAQPSTVSAPLAGTITIGPRARPLTVDGTPITPTTSLIVPCGVHVVRVGNDKAQTVDVPCGGTILVKRQIKKSR